ncbi:MAG TPA: hypothetical protein VMT15_16685 [Bryobacteraceae bacterium]|nr:hypothetical protein [Bryobacteraceae bacterium]
MLSRGGLALFPLIAVLLPFYAHSQVLLGGPGVADLRMMNSDLAVLEAQEVRKDLPCTVTPAKPVLGFDLRFHSGYDVNVPLRELAGGENKLTILFRVIPPDHKSDPVYFVQHVRVPSIEEDAHGDAVLGGGFDLGEGSYHVDWLMRDRSERVCSFYWDSEATLSPKDKQITLEMAPGSIRRSQDEQFVEDPPVQRTATTGPPLNIKVLVNFAPQNYDSFALRPMDTIALVSILRRISREPKFGRFSVVAFNIQEQRVLYRQASAERIDFPALGKALQSMKLGTVDTKRLAQKHGDTEFLTELIKQEMRADDHPDALVFAGPKVMLDASVPQETLTPIATDVDYPVFYMNYNLNPQQMPWKDSISRAVKVFRGTEYTISRPRDLWLSFSEMVARVVKSGHSHPLLPSSANELK